MFEYHDVLMRIRALSLKEFIFRVLNKQRSTTHQFRNTRLYFGRGM